MAGEESLLASGHIHGDHQGVTGVHYTGPALSKYSLEEDKKKLIANDFNCRG